MKISNKRKSKKLQNLSENGPLIKQDTKNLFTKQNIATPRIHGSKRTGRNGNGRKQQTTHTIHRHEQSPRATTTIGPTTRRRGAKNPQQKRTTAKIRRGKLHPTQSQPTEQPPQITLIRKPTSTTESNTERRNGLTSEPNTPQQTHGHNEIPENVAVT